MSGRAANVSAKAGSALSGALGVTSKFASQGSGAAAMNRGQMRAFSFVIVRAQKFLFFKLYTSYTSYWEVAEALW